MAIRSCNGCVPPKRTPACKFDGTCDKYAIAKEKHEQEREARMEAKRVNYSIVCQKADRVQKALRKKGIRYGESIR